MGNDLNIFGIYIYMQLTNKLTTIVHSEAISRSGMENDFNGKQKLSCVIIPKNQSWVLHDWTKLL